MINNKMNSESIFDLLGVEPISSEQKEEVCAFFEGYNLFENEVAPPWYDAVVIATSVVTAIAGSSMFWHKNLRTHP